MSEMVVERILKKQLRNGEVCILQNNWIWCQFSQLFFCVFHSIALFSQPYYLLKWEGLNNRHNSWEPIENLTGCAELLAEFETSRAFKVLGLARRNNGDIMYVIQMYDALAPEIVNNRQVRILWSKLAFRFLLSKIKFVGFETCASVPTTFLSTIPTNSSDRDVDPQIVCK